MKMYHTPFIKFIAYQLQVGENLTMFLQNADGAKIESMDESIVQILNAGENGEIVNNQTSTKGINQGSTQLKITLEATSDKRKTTIFLPIKVQNMATKGSFNVGNSAGGTTYMQSMPRSFGILQGENNYWSLVGKSSNASNNEYPRMINLTPNILNLETISEANKQSTLILSLQRACIAIIFGFSCGVICGIIAANFKSFAIFIKPVVDILQGITPIIWVVIALFFGLV